MTQAWKTCGVIPRPNIVAPNRNAIATRYQKAPQAPTILLDVVTDVYTDGAASHPTDSQWSSAGSGVVIPNLNFEIAMPAPGFCQSNQAGEIFAIVIALRHCCGPKAIWTDSNYVCKQWNKLEEIHVPAHNWDYLEWWTEIADMRRSLKNLGIPCTVSWVKGHATPKDIAEG